MTSVEAQRVTSSAAPAVASSPQASLINDIGDVLELGVLTLDRERRITGWNRWLEIASGRLAKHIIGRPLIEIFPEVTSTGADRAISRALNGETVVLAHRFHPTFLHLRAPAGDFGVTLMQQSTRLLPHIDADGRIVGVVVVIEDVTERVARDNELRKALRLAESANRTKAEFLASMSHELRTPLGAISGYSDLLMEGIFGPLTDDQRPQLERIKRVTTHILGIVDEILTFARLEAGREEVRFGEVDATLIAREAATVVEPSLRAKGIEFQLSIPEGALTLITDELKLSQILINLLGNAAKFVDRGHVGLRVRVDAERRDVLFEVHDTGPGISAANLERVFEPFTQVDASFKRRSMGAGLGLPLSRQLARTLGGDITLKSELGKGSTFTVRLPQRPIELAG